MWSSPLTALLVSQVPNRGEQSLSRPAVPRPHLLIQPTTWLSFAATARSDAYAACGPPQHTGPFLQGCSPSSLPTACSSHQTIPCQMQGLLVAFAGICEVPVSPFLHPIKIPLSSSPVQPIYPSPQASNKHCSLLQLFKKIILSLSLDLNCSQHVHEAAEVMSPLSKGAIQTPHSCVTGHLPFLTASVQHHRLDCPSYRHLPSPKHNEISSSPRLEYLALIL